MTQYREILRLFQAGISQRSIAASCQVSQPPISLLKYFLLRPQSAVRSFPRQQEYFIALQPLCSLGQPSSHAVSAPAIHCQPKFITIIGGKVSAASVDDVKKIFDKKEH